jgi:hypothetical protein
MNGTQINKKKNDTNNIKKIIVCDLDTHLGGTFETSGHHFGDNVHKILGFLDDVVNFCKSGRFTNSVIFNSELQPLHKRWHFV